MEDYAVENDDQTPLECSMEDDSTVLSSLFFPPFSDVWPFPKTNTLSLFFHFTF